MSNESHATNELEALRLLKQELEKLPDSIEPERDLWHGIEQRIQHKPARSRGRVWELAIAASVAAVVSSAMFLGFGQSRDATTQAVPTLAAYQQLDAAYLPVRKVSLERYNAQADKLDPAVRATVEKNLAIIDQALDEIRAALKNRPNDPALNALLQRTYEQEMAVLSAVTPAQEI